MKTVLLVTPDERLRARLGRALAAYSVFVAQNDGDALKTLRLIEIDLVIREGAGPGHGLEAFVSRLKEVAPEALTIAIEPALDEVDAADFVVPGGFGQRELEAALRRAAEKHRLARELATLRSRAASPPPAPSAAEAPWDGATLARILTEFTRVFAAGFDLSRLLDMFLDAIGRLVRPVRMALLLPDPNGEDYRIRAHRGLPPQLVDSLRLSATTGLSRWLATQGRPARVQDLADAEVTRELTLLQGVVAIPLLANGELVAMLVIGQPVMGGQYDRRETETLFDLAAHVATAIRNIALHEQLRREMEFNERILAHMSSGVITIGRDHRVGTLNRRAEEILELAAQTVLGQDLRVLPSPLGDMLFGTLSSGHALARSEIQLALRGRWLEVSTYPIYGDEPTPLGAVLVFEDLTAQKELANQKRQAEQLQLLTRVVARIADEIKNPLVSINTFMELIEERFDDPDFRKHFSAVVGRDVRRLVQVFEKLAGLVSEGELNFVPVDVHTVIDELVAAIELGDDTIGKPVQLEVARETTPQVVKVDPAQLRKAFSYLVRYLGHNSPVEPAKVSISVGRHPDGDGDAGVRVLFTSRTAAVAPDKLQRLFDPVQMVQESLIDVGPAVSQRLIEAFGGRLRLRQSRHELAFLVTLPAAP
ncbi:MAG: GAF domain-containing protein [Candidatus Rokubacteria bacterium]|nr:GAF domain-containing protein [Candidatus Rokubacteria bacterium]